MVLITLLGTLLGYRMGWLPEEITIVLIGGGSIVALVGWIDDTKGLPAPVRLFVHLVAAAWLVFWLGGITGLYFGQDSGPVRMAGNILSVLAVAWAINAYNFMDGIDALAGAEAAWVGAIGGAFALASGNSAVAFLSFLLASASVGFLCWNFPPARIFLGDVGSGFLGYSFAVLAVFSARSASLPVIAWVVLLGVFVFDATFTLLRRMARHEAWYATHRQSAYQRAAFKMGRHGPVTLGILFLNVILSVLCSVGLQTPDSWREIGLTALAILILTYVGVERYSPMPKSKSTASSIV